MNRVVEPAAAFRDGSVRSPGLLDLLVAEVEVEVARLRSDGDGRASPSFGEDLWVGCLRILSHPAVEPRLRRLECSLSRLWLDPLGVAGGLGTESESILSRTVAVRPRAGGRLAGGSARPGESTVELAELSRDRSAVLVPFCDRRRAREPHRNRLPVGTRVGREECVAGLGRVGWSRLAEENV